MVRGLINEVQPNVLAKKHNMTRCNVRVVFWHEARGENVTANIGESSSLYSEFSEGVALTTRPLE
jgi:hypothetical protein